MNTPAALALLVLTSGVAAQQTTNSGGLTNGVIGGIIAASIILGCGSVVYIYSEMVWRRKERAAQDAAKDAGSNVPSAGQIDVCVPEGAK